MKVNLQKKCSYDESFEFFNLSEVINFLNKNTPPKGEKTLEKNCGKRFFKHEISKTFLKI